MRLTEALSKQPREQLELIASECDVNYSNVPSPLLVSRLEAVLPNPSRVEYALVRRRPPVLSLMGLLLERTLSVSADEARALANRHCEEVCRLVRVGTIADDDQRRLYRRVLAEAWRSDEAVDLSEARLLGVLRRELGLRQIEHFVCAHHRDVMTHWKRSDSFETVLTSLKSSGLVFAVEKNLVLPEDLESAVRDALGVHATLGASFRLLAALDGHDLYEALKDAGLKSSGSKQAKVERLLVHFVSPREILHVLHINDLRDLAAKSGARKSGAKDELIRRIVEHFNSGGDLEGEQDEVEVELLVEKKALNEEEFGKLFAAFRGSELAHILYAHRPLRQSGSKATKVETLWASRFSEATLLKALDSATLGQLLRRLDLRVSGSKAIRIERLIDAHRHARVAPKDARPVTTHGAASRNDNAVREIDHPAED